MIDQALLRFTLPPALITMAIFAALIAWQANYQISTEPVDRPPSFVEQ